MGLATCLYQIYIGGQALSSQQFEEQSDEHYGAGGSTQNGTEGVLISRASDDGNTLAYNCIKEK